MDKYARFLACMILGLAVVTWCMTTPVDCTVRLPTLNSLFSSHSGPGGAEGEGASSRYFPHSHSQPPPFRILPTILSIKNGRVRLNYGFHGKFRGRQPAPSSYSHSDWTPIPRKPGPPKLPTSYGPKNHSPPPPSGWQPEPPKGWQPGPPPAPQGWQPQPEPPKGWHPEPPKGWAPKKKHVIYVLLKEPDVKTHVQVVDSEKSEPEVILQYEGGSRAQTHYEINKPTPQPQAVLEQQPGPEVQFVPLPVPVPSPQPTYTPTPTPTPSPTYEPTRTRVGGYIIQNQPQQQQQLVLEEPVADAVNPSTHNILNGYSGYSLSTLNTKGLPISLVFKRMPEVQVAEPELTAAASVAAADSIGSTNERVEVSVSSVTKQVSST